MNLESILDVSLGPEGGLGGPFQIKICRAENPLWMSLTLGIAARQ